MYWLVKRVDNDLFDIVDEDIVDGVAGVGKRVEIRDPNGDYDAVLKSSGTRRTLEQLQKQMENGASTPDATKRKRKNNMTLGSPSGTQLPTRLPSSSSRRVSTANRPQSSSISSAPLATVAPGASRATTSTVSQPQPIPSSMNSAAAYLPLNASAGLNNVLDGILAYMRQTDTNMERMEKKLDDFIIQAAPLIKDGADFANAASQQLEGFDEWKKQVAKEHKSLKRAVDTLQEKIPSQPGFRYTYLSREKVDAIDSARSMNAQRLASALQKEVYKNNPREMKKNVDKRVDQGAVKFIFDCVLYRRQYSTQDQKDLAITAMKERLNQYASNGRAEQKKSLKSFTKRQRPKKKKIIKHVTPPPPRPNRRVQLDSSVSSRDQSPMLSHRSSRDNSRNASDHSRESSSESRPTTSKKRRVGRHSRDSSLLSSPRANDEDSPQSHSMNIKQEPVE